MSWGVLLAERQSLLRAGVRRLVDDFGGFRVVAETGDGLEALRMVRELNPRIALVGCELHGLTGHDLVARIARGGTETLPVVLSDHATSEHAQRALRAGAQGFVLTSAGPQDLEQALHSVLRGQRWLSPVVAHALIATAAETTVGGTRRSRAPTALTERQREVLQLIAEGYATRDIAQRLSLSAKTVEAHRARIMTRLRIYDIAGLTRFAVRTGLVDADL